MQQAAKAIESQALALPVTERAELVCHLLSSLDDREPADASAVQAAWIALANRRYQALLSGADAGQSHDEVFAELRAERR